MIDALRNALRLADLRNKIFFTLLILVIYRLAAHVPVPHVDTTALRTVFGQNQLLGFLDLFSGGALSRVTIFALGIMPYISASIIMQLLTVVIPAIGKLAKEGEAGRKKIVK